MLGNNVSSAAASQVDTCDWKIHVRKQSWRCSHETSWANQNYEGPGRNPWAANVVCPLLTLKGVGLSRCLWRGFSSHTCSQLERWGLNLEQARWWPSGPSGPKPDHQLHESSQKCLTTHPYRPDQTTRQKHLDQSPQALIITLSAVAVQEFRGHQVKRVLSNPRGVWLQTADLQQTAYVRRRMS